MIGDEMERQGGSGSPGTALFRQIWEDLLTQKEELHDLMHP